MIKECVLRTYHSMPTILAHDVVDTDIVAYQDKDDHSINVLVQVDVDDFTFKNLNGLLYPDLDCEGESPALAIEVAKNCGHRVYTFSKIQEVLDFFSEV